jgi:hypothetical protein
MALDKSRNGELSTEEMKAATVSLLKLDKNKSNSLSKDELIPEPPKGKGKSKGGKGKSSNDERPPPPSMEPSKLMAAIDKDSSGDLTQEELAAAPLSLLALDANGDKKLSSEESGITKQPRQGGGGPQGGPQGGQQGGPPGGGRPPGQ